MPRPRVYNRSDALDAAMNVFWQHGYEASSIQKLIEATGMNRGSLYAAFTDKQTLFKQAVDSYGDTIREMVNRQRARENPADPVGSIKQFFEALFIEQAEQELANGCLLFNTITELSVSDPGLAQYAAGKIAPVREMFHRYVERAIALGRVPNENDPNVLVEALIASIAGLRVLCKMSTSSEQLSKILNKIISSLL